MKSFWKRLTSRKFIASMIGVVVGVAVVFGVDGDTITNVAGTVTALASLMTYIISEGRIDAASVSSTITTILDESTDAESEDK